MRSNPLNENTDLTNSILEGVIVLELASVLAGPLVGSFLASCGAHVIKVENPLQSGDVTRQWKNHKEDASAPSSSYYLSANVDKEVVYINFKEDLDSLEHYISQADIIISNIQKHTAEKYHIDPYSVMCRYPHKIFGQLDAYAYDDPRPGYDMVMQAESGYISMCGTDSDHLAKIPTAMMDILAAHHMKESLLLAYILQQRTGKGSMTFTSLYQSALTGLVNQATNYLNQGLVASPMGTCHPNIAPYGEIFECKDGIRIMLVVGSDWQFERLCQVIGIAREHMNPYLRNAERVIYRSSLYDLLQSHIKAIGYEDLRTLLEHEGLPYANIIKINEVFVNELAKKMIYTHKNGQQSLQHIAFTISQ